MQSSAVELMGRPPAGIPHTAVAAAAVEEPAARARKAVLASGRVGQPGAASMEPVAAAGVVERVVPVAEGVADELAARGQLALASPVHSDPVEDIVAKAAAGSGMGRAQLQTEHWAMQSGSGLVVGSKRKRSGHLSGSCRLTRVHSAAEEEKGGSFEGWQSHWEDNLTVVDTGWAVQMPASCPVVGVVAVVAAAGGIGAEEDPISRHVGRSWHTGVGE